MAVIQARLKLRRDEASMWSSVNPVLALGEVGIDTTNKRMKVGTGVDNWNSLTYLDDNIYKSLESLIKLVGGMASNGSIKDPVERPSDRPTSGNVTGDIIFVKSEGKFYKWNGSAWEEIVNSGSGNKPAVTTPSELPSGSQGAASGDLRYVSGEKRFYFFDGTRWLPLENTDKAAVSSTSQITNPYTGEIVFNTTDNKFYFYDGSKWNELKTGSDDDGQNQGSGIKVGTNLADIQSKFTNPSAGDLAFATTSKEYYYYNGSNWVSFNSNVSQTDINSMVSNAITNYDLLGMGYTIAEDDHDDSNGMPTKIVFEDDSCIVIKWVTGTNDRVEYVHYYENKANAGVSSVQPEIKMNITYDSVGRLKSRTIQRKGRDYN